MAGYLDEYLVRLGVSTDDAGLGKLTDALKGISDLAGSTGGAYAELATAFIKFETAVAGAAAGLIGAVGKMAESVAVADQEYRLFGLTMFMNADAAKKLKITLDALGQPLGMIAWDTELRKRAYRLIQLQNVMQKGMAANGDEADFLKIRDVRNELAALEVEWTYFKQALTAGLAKAFAPELNALQTWLTKLTDQIASNLPAIAQKVDDYLAPALREAWTVLQGMGEALKASATAFTNFMGALSGDQSLQSATFNADKFATALGKIGTRIANISDAFSDFGIVVAHLVTMLSMLQSGDLKGALQEARDTSRFLLSGGTAEGYNARGFAEGVGPMGELESDNPAHDSSEPSDPARPSGFGETVVSAARSAFMPWTAVTDLWKKYGASSASAPGNQDILNAVRRVSLKTGIAPDLIWSQWAHETGGFKHIAAPNNLAGIKAPSGGYKSFGSLTEFGDYYAYMMRQGGRYSGIEQSQTPADFAGRAKTGGYYEDSQRNYTAGMERWDSVYKNANPKTTNFTGDVNVHVHMPKPLENGDEFGRAASPHIQRATLWAIQQGSLQ